MEGQYLFMTISLYSFRIHTYIQCILVIYTPSSPHFPLALSPHVLCPPLTFMPLFLFNNPVSPVSTGVMGLSHLWVVTLPKEMIPPPSA